MISNKLYLLFSLLVFQTFSFSQKPSSEIYQDIKKLHSLKRVLYIAAHPDDENTRAIAWFSLGENAQTAYLSLTRGDGGQNLIGNELGDDLGVLRTYELLAARNIDRAQQFFTRAVDFGYSKTAEESFEKWGKEEILRDVVYVIRLFKPDVIVTRFPPDKRAGHGHHIASAILAIEAFEKAADPLIFPDQVKELGTWRAQSVYWNASNWWNKDIHQQAENNPDYIIANIGTYNSLLGQSHNEIGTLARSQHKCQGFGSTIERGNKIEYFQYLAGEKLNGSFFNTTSHNWQTMVDKKIENKFQKLFSTFDFVNTEKNIPQLLDIYENLSVIKDKYMRDEKLKLCQHIILDCIGFYGELNFSDFSFTQNEKIELDLNLINRSGIEVKVEKLRLDDVVLEFEKLNLPKNEVLTKKIPFSSRASFSNPFWLKNKSQNNLFQVSLTNIAIMPVLNYNSVGILTLKINETEIPITIPITHKWGDPSYGERKREVILTPNFSVNFEENVSVFTAGETKKVKVNVHSFQSNLKDTLFFNAPKGWIITPEKIPLDIEKKQGEQSFFITIESGKNAERDVLELKNHKNETLFTYQEIKYDHIPTSARFFPAELELIPLDIKIKKGEIAYIKGVDEDVPKAIEQLGFGLKILSFQEITLENLKNYQSVVIGIRAFNVFPELYNFRDIFKNYIHQGGNLVIQYNTLTSTLKEMELGPYPFEISRKRITEEDSKVKFVNPSHSILNIPNKITDKDFENWVQERGLYFAENWSNDYETLLSWHDTNEDPLEGAIIVTKYGKGQFVYTGISFFRQLPVGVEGAYKLFANILSYSPNGE